MSKIETGVDKLVELISLHEKIAVDAAAKKLGVSPVVVQEWADFLEEEKIISIEYKFSKTFLVQRKLSHKEIKEKSKEFKSEKDAFIRKVETSLRSLDGESIGLEKIKTEFDKVRKDIGDEIYKVKDELSELEKYESLKNTLDQKLVNQQNEFHKILDGAHSQMKREEKKYQELLEKLEIEKREFEIKESRLKSLAEKELALKDKIKAIFDLANSIQQKVDEERKDILGTEDRIKHLEGLVTAIEEDIIRKKKEIQPVIDKSEKQNQKIFEIQDSIIEKAQKATARIKAEVKESELIAEKFKTFFDKKNEIENILKDLDTEQDELKSELSQLIKKAVAFDVAAKGVSIREHVEELEHELQSVEKEKAQFKHKVQKLIKLVKG